MNMLSRPLKALKTVRFGVLSAAEFAQRVGPPLMFMGAVVVGLFAVDLILYTVSRLAGAPVDVKTWGTYASWAAAVLPTVGIVATLGMWFVNQTEKDARDALDQAILVVVERPEGGVASLLNNSNWPVEVVAVTPAMPDRLGRVVRPGGARLLLMTDTRLVRFRIRGFVFEEDTSGDVRRVGV